MAKLEHLQFLRGIAVLAVVLYHFFPSFTSNGLVGVDMFFVLSGFLMMMVFGSREITFKKSLDFYYRRVKRIVPMYLIALLLTLAAVYFIYPIMFLLLNADPIAPAMFYTNIQNFHSENDYFQQLLRGASLYSHTWSLGVEMQFYVVAPLFFFVQTKLRQFSIIAECVFLAVAFYGSLLSNAFFNDTIAFNSTPCRLWQFVTGIICYRLCDTYHMKENRTENKKSADEIPSSLGEFSAEKEDKPIKSDTDATSSTKETLSRSLFFSLLLALAVLVFAPIKENTTAIRVQTTLVTGTLIVIEPMQTVSPMKNRLVCYIGDISYSLYLIHWGVCTYAKYFFDEYSYQYFITFALCFLLSVISYELIEKSYLKLGKVSILLLIVALYVSLFAVILEKDNLAKWTENRWEDKIAHFNKTALTKGDIITMNELADYLDHSQMIDTDCYPHLEYGRCDFNKTKLGKASNMSILVVGNSYTSNQAGLVMNTFGKFARSIKRLGRPGCQPLITQTASDCIQYKKEFYNFIAEEQPDVVFLISRCFAVQTPLHDPLLEDPLVQEMSENLETFAKSIKKRVFILNCMPQVSDPAVATYMGRLNKLILNGEPIIADELVGDHGHVIGRKRMELVAKHCSKCILFDYMPSMSDENGFHVADPRTNLSYYTTSSHLTQHGLETVLPVYQRLAREFEHDLVN